jgi:hypothetical protein
MAPSLKAFLPILASALNEKPDTLYERQRALVREGLLETLPGRGRGSGVQATAESVAALLIGMLGSVSLADAGPAARSFADAKHSTKCPLTGAKNFHAALAAILSDDRLAKRVTGIAVRVKSGQVAIGFDGSSAEQDLDMTDLKIALEGQGVKNMKLSPAPTSSIFVARKASKRGLRVNISIGRETVRELTKAVIQLLKDDADTALS